MTVASKSKERLMRQSENSAISRETSEPGVMGLWGRTSIRAGWLQEKWLKGITLNVTFLIHESEARVVESVFLGALSSGTVLITVSERFLTVGI
jgi:hypothetical protein